MEGTAMAFDHGEAFWLVKTAIRPLEQQVVLLTSQGPPNPFQSHPYSTSVTHISYILALECSLKHVQTNCDVIVSYFLTDQSQQNSVIKHQVTLLPVSLGCKTGRTLHYTAGKNR